MPDFKMAVCLGVVLTRSITCGVPFLVEAGEDVHARFAGAPRLHSFAWAQWDGKWIFLAGRTGGYHGVGGAESDFSRAGANTRIWVVDPGSDPQGDGPARTFSFAVSDLPASLTSVKNQWMSSNVLFFQDGDSLYIAGGYGQDSKGAWVTHAILSVVPLPALVEGVTQGRDTFSGSISYVESPLVQVSGGELIKLDDGMFYIAGGHVFTGTYGEFEAAGEKNGSRASQTYIGEIRKLRVARDGEGKLSVTLLERFRDPEFARRDLNAAFRILPDGHSLAAAAYGGVFTKEQLAFAKPIYWSASTEPTLDESFEQKMSAYTCARILFFDPDSRSMYTTFFGGISRWTWDYAKKREELASRAGERSDSQYFDGLTWIDHITTLVHEAGRTYEVTQPDTRLPGYLGADAAFLPAAGLARIRPDADVYDLSPLRGKRVLAGYIYGGIRAFPRQFPYHDDSKPYRSGNVPTKASDMIVPVYITVPGK